MRVYMTEDTQPWVFMSRYPIDPDNLDYHAYEVPEKLVDEYDRTFKAFMDVMTRLGEVLEKAS